MPINRRAKMPRPSKEKRVCRLPLCDRFQAAYCRCPNHRIQMSVEEYETIRLIDYMGLTQEECAAAMDVGRATVQTLYTDARKKLARFLVEASSLEIQGGNFVIGQNGSRCGREKRQDAKKGDYKMRLAVTFENGEIFQHFGHTEQFKVYDVEDGKISGAQIVDTNGSGHAALAGFLKDLGVDVLICGGIGGGARNALAEAGIELFPGACGDADAQVESYLAGNLNYDPDTVCNHHGHGHGEGNCEDHGQHECGHHCGE